MLVLHGGFATWVRGRLDRSPLPGSGDPDEDEFDLTEKTWQLGVYGIHPQRQLDRTGQCRNVQWSGRRGKRELEPVTIPCRRAEPRRLGVHPLRD